MHYERRKGGFAVSTDPGRLDVAAVHAFLTQAYWSVGIPRDVVERALANSLCFGLYAADGQVGLARVISDRATFAYLCDVYVLPEWRGRGLGRWLMECVMDHPELAGVRRFILVTRDAHELYRPFGFGEPVRPEIYMEIAPPNPYLKQG
jgi:GNAT superfamily N-acetyltransferase